MIRIEVTLTSSLRCPGLGLLFAPHDCSLRAGTTAFLTQPFLSSSQESTYWSDHCLFLLRRKWRFREPHSGLWRGRDWGSVCFQWLISLTDRPRIRGLAMRHLKSCRPESDTQGSQKATMRAWRRAVISWGNVSRCSRPFLCLQSHHVAACDHSQEMALCFRRGYTGLPRQSRVVSSSQDGGIWELSRHSTCFVSRFMYNSVQYFELA